MRRLARMLALTTGLTALAACGGEEATTDAETGAPDPVEQTAPEIDLAAGARATAAQEAAEAAVAFLADNAKKEGVQITPTGLQYQILAEGPEDGDSPFGTDLVEVHYRGVLLNGAQFDSSYDRGAPAVFPLDRVIAGWTEGLQLMSEGDRFRFFVPPDLAYGARGSGIGLDRT